MSVEGSNDKSSQSSEVGKEGDEEEEEDDETELGTLYLSSFSSSAQTLS